MAQPNESEVEPIPFFELDEACGLLSATTAPLTGTKTCPVGMVCNWAEDQAQEASVADWDLSAAYGLVYEVYATRLPEVGLVGASRSPMSLRSDQLAGLSHGRLLENRGLTSSVAFAAAPVPTFGVDTASAKASTAKPRASRAQQKSKSKRHIGDAVSVVQEHVDDTHQATRKSEIEKKSRLKRAKNIGAMKMQVAQLEQSLLQLTKSQKDAAVFNEFQHHDHFEQPIQTRLMKLRALLARQFQESVNLRNEQFRLYQQLQHFVDLNDTLRNIVSAQTFADPSVYDLLSWWEPPSDAQCQQLADDSIAKLRSFTFSKRHVTDEHAGWKLSYEQSVQEGIKFMITRNISKMNVPAVAQSIWHSRFTTEGANLLAGGVCKAEITVIKSINKDMAVINRSLRFPAFSVHTLYLMFRVEIDGVFYLVSRELGRSQSMSWDNSTHDFPETSVDQWVDVFTWSKFTKVPYDPTAAICGSHQCTAASNLDEDIFTHRLDYGGWWGTSYALGVRRWLMEMIFMVVRWEALYIQPHLPGAGSFLVGHA